MLCHVLFQSSSNIKQAPLEPLYVVEVLLYCNKTPKKLAAGEVPMPCNEEGKGEMQVEFFLPVKSSN